MDLSGRFNFWRVLILTRAITPPQVPGSLWPRLMNSKRAGWWLVLIVAVLAAGAIAVTLARGEPPLQSRAIGPVPTAASSPSSVTPGPRW
jgi:hypothetical protein